MTYWFAFSSYRKLYLFSSLIEFISSEELDCKTLHEKPVFWKAGCIECLETNVKYFGHPSFTTTFYSVSVPTEIMQCIFNCFRMRSNYVRAGKTLVKVFLEGQLHRKADRVPLWWQQLRSFKSKVALRFLWVFVSLGLEEMLLRAFMWQKYSSLSIVFLLKYHILFYLFSDRAFYQYFKLLIMLKTWAPASNLCNRHFFLHLVMFFNLLVQLSSAFMQSSYPRFAACSKLHPLSPDFR